MQRKILLIAIVWSRRIRGKSDDSFYLQLERTRRKRAPLNITFGVMIDSTSEPMHEAALTFRRASRDDVPAVVRMLAYDALGAKRETLVFPLPDSYYAAFEAIDRDANNELVVAELDGRIIGVLQITFIPCMTYRGGWRALIEGVRVDSEIRSRGFGRQLFTWAIDRARQRDCHLIQLTSDKARPDAIRFYESLGFAASHEGLKLHLDHPSVEPK
jgi:GNAT superfamily N-acetyltransferase